MGTGEEELTLKFLNEESAELNVVANDDDDDEGIGSWG